MTTRKLPLSQFPFGACPFMSEVYMQSATKLTMPAGTGPIPLGSAALKVDLIPVACLGPDCQLWDDERLRCDIGPAREVWTHEQNLPAGALTGTSGADVAERMVKALNALLLPLNIIAKRPK
jgi:hypothetical protein